MSLIRLCFPILACPMGSQSASVQLPVSASSVPFGDPIRGFTLSLDDSLQIAGGSVQRNTEANHVLTLQWPNMTPTPSYDESLPR